MASLSVTVQSSNPAVANAAVVGTGAVRDIDISAVGVGTTTLTFTVTDGGGLTAQTTQLVGVSAAEAAGTFNHYGISDASTALDLGNGAMVVADDETNILRIYERQASKLPSTSVDLVALGLALPDAVTREVDIEAAARSGSTVVLARVPRAELGWRDEAEPSAPLQHDDLRNGRGDDLHARRVLPVPPDRPDRMGRRQRPRPRTRRPRARRGVHGRPRAQRRQHRRRRDRPRRDDAPGRVPGAAAVRSRTGRADHEPAALVAGNPTTGVTASFGAPILLDLGGRGVRDLRRNATGDYLILAGPSGTGSDFRLYSWNGSPASAPVPRPAISRTWLPTAASNPSSRCRRR